MWNGLPSDVIRRPRRCRCSRTGRRHTCSAAATKLFDFNDISFSWSLSPLENSGPCNSFYCLGHSKNVYDDDDNDDDGLVFVRTGSGVNASATSEGTRKASKSSCKE